MVSKRRFYQISRNFRPFREEFVLPKISFDSPPTSVTGRGGGGLGVKKSGPTNFLSISDNFLKNFGGGEGEILAGGQTNQR